MPHCKQDPVAIPDISKLNLEQRIQLAIKAIDDSVLLQDGHQKLSIRKAAEAFHVACTSLRDRYIAAKTHPSLGGHTCPMDQGPRSSWSPHLSICSR